MSWPVTQVDQERRTTGPIALEHVGKAGGTEASSPHRVGSTAPRFQIAGSTPASPVRPGRSTQRRRPPAPRHRQRCPQPFARQPPVAFGASRRHAADHRVSVAFAAWPLAQVRIGDSPNRASKLLVALAGYVVVVEPKADRAGHVPSAPAPIGSNPRDVHLPVGYQRLDRNVLKDVSKPGFTSDPCCDRLPLEGWAAAGATLAVGPYHVSDR